MTNPAVPVPVQPPARAERAADRRDLGDRHHERGLRGDVIDDDESIRELLAWLMKRNAMRVETFPDARAFLRAYRAEAPGCLILDLYMPGMSGLDLQRYLKENGVQLPVIFLSGRADVPKAVWRILWSWSVVREKRARIRQAQRGRNLGLTVICDRYPQAQIMALGDGPLLSHWEGHPWGWLRAAARRELEAYRRLETVAPDLVIKLHVTPEVSARRKLDVSLDSLARRVEVVRQVQFGQDTRVAQVDATQSLEQVLLDTKRIVWEAL